MGVVFVFSLFPQRFSPSCCAFLHSCFGDTDFIPGWTSLARAPPPHPPVGFAQEAHYWDCKYSVDALMDFFFFFNNHTTSKKMSIFQCSPTRLLNWTSPNVSVHLRDSLSAAFSFGGRNIEGMRFLKKKKEKKRHVLVEKCSIYMLESNIEMEYLY